MKIHLATLALLVLVAACAPAASPGEMIAPPPDWPISLTSIQTEVNENKSGKNTFSFTMPLRASCTFPELDAALRKLQDEDKKLVAWTSRDDTETKLRQLQVTFRFDDPAEISGQVGRLKLIAIQSASARATAVPTAASPLTAVPGRTVTPGAGPTATPVPTPTLPVLLEAHELYIDIAPPMDTLTGKSYKTTITLNPQTLAGGAGPCAVRSFTYQLTMPGEISGADLGTLTDIDRQAIASNSPPGQANTVIWTVDLNQLAKGRAGEATRANATLQAQVTEFLSEVDRLGKTGTVVASYGPAEVTRWSETESPRYATLGSQFSQLLYTATPVPALALTLTASSQPQGAAIKFL
ncbi:MAG: hypothetical protein ACM3S0_15100, partial [Acidobacteriota bacterium]